MFQFTHPGRGATILTNVRICVLGRFNSRTPGGVRPQSVFDPRKTKRFNSRTPGGVRRLLLNSLKLLIVVSIHAPREGCDWTPVPNDGGASLFQFTHPGRGATLARRLDNVTIEFQFTHPGRGATRSRYVYASADVFQFTHPGRGATTLSLLLLPSRPGFNSRTPGGVRLNQEVWTGVVLKFQFTHPGRGATPPNYPDLTLQIVSIHAPREGCDLVLSMMRRAPLGFQFTHPGRGATVQGCQ